MDCNRGRGTWKSTGSQLELGPLALTRAACPEGSLHDQIVKQWGSVRSFVIKDGHLFLSLHGRRRHLRVRAAAVEEALAVTSPAAHPGRWPARLAIMAPSAGAAADSPRIRLGRSPHEGG